MSGNNERVKFGLRILLFSFLFVLISLNLSFADKNQRSIEPFRIELEIIHDGLGGHRVQIAITKMAGSEELRSFDFRLQYNSEALTFFDINESEIFDIPGSHEWEYLSYRAGITTESLNDTPYRTLRILGQADRTNDTHQPVDLMVPDGTVLAYLNFHITNYGKYECHFIPISFYWTTCDDNSITLADSTGVSIAISDIVYDYWDNDITNNTADLPTYNGAPDACLDQSGDTTAIRLIDFKSGGVDIVCTDSWEPVGDLNLNGHPYEIADFVVYQNIFRDGLIFFNFVPWPPEEVIEQSDINRDGFPLSVADLVMLIRIIDGVVFPIP